MKINKLLFVSLTLPIVGLCVSCSGGASDNIQDNDTVSDTVTTVVDSIAKAKADSVKNQEAPERKFSGTAEELQFMQNSGHWSEYQNGIIPRMAQEVPEYAGKLLNNKYKHFIVVDKAAMKVILYDKYGQMVKEYPCAASKNYGNKKRKGDSRTAEGYFTAEGIYDSTNWLFTNDAGYTSPARGQFGPRFIRLKGAPQIGIHGTAAPRSIGRRVSHGCIRLTNENILDLVKYAEAGMPIIVSPGPQDMRVNANEGTPVPAITTGATRTEPAPEPPKKDTKKETKADTKTDKNKSQSVIKPAENNQGESEVKENVTEKKEETKPAETKPAEEKKETPATPSEPSTPPAN